MQEEKIITNIITKKIKFEVFIIFLLFFLIYKSKNYICFLKVNNKNGILIVLLSIIKLQTMELNSDIFKIKHNGIAPKQGNILISEPFAPDSIFSRSVILLAEHNEEGTIGFILNKPLKQNLAQITDNFGNIDMKVSIGGPVSEANIYYIHTYGKLIPESIKIKNNLYWGGNFKVLQTLLESGTVDESKIRFFIGYSGWQLKQLENELKKDFWLVSDIDTKTIMRYDKKIWNKVISRLEKRYSIWQHFPENPNLN